MHPFPIDMYAYHNRLRDAHPAEKMLFSGLTMLVCLIASSPVVALLALAFVTVAVVRVAGIPLRAFWFFVRLPTGFILLGVLTLAITSVDPANPETLVALPVGPWHVGVMGKQFGARRAGHVGVLCVRRKYVGAGAYHTDGGHHRSTAEVARTPVVHRTNGADVSVYLRIHRNRAGDVYRSECPPRLQQLAAFAAFGGHARRQSLLAFADAGSGALHRADGPGL